VDCGEGGLKGKLFVGRNALLAGGFNMRLEAMSMAADIQARVEVLRNLREQKQQQSAFSEVLEEISNTLTNAYKSAAQKARNTGTPEEETEIWQEMSEACNSALVEMKKVKEVLPTPAGGNFYDRILDLKLAAEQRKNWVLEEQACRNKMPKGLFPEKS
jgi:hypothetical protein